MALAPADPVPPPVSGLGGSPVPAPRAPERRKGASGCGLLPRARIYSRGLKQPLEYTLTSRSNSSSSLGLQEKTKSLQRKNSRAGSRRARKAWSGAKQGRLGPASSLGEQPPGRRRLPRGLGDQQRTRSPSSHGCGWSRFPGKEKELLASQSLTGTDPLFQSSITSVIEFFLNRSPRIILRVRLRSLFSTVGVQGLNWGGGGVRGAVPDVRDSSF